MAYLRAFRSTFVVGIISLLLSTASLAEVGQIEAVVLEGDDVAGVGLVSSIANLAVNSAGDWLVEVDTDNPDTNADGAMLSTGGVVLLVEGQALAEPAGALLDSFDAVNLNDAGNSGWNLFLDGTSGFDDDSGVYLGTDLLIQEGDVSLAPELSPGTPYIGFFDAKIADDDSILLMASVDDPAIETSVDRVLVVLTIDATGNLISESVVAKEGDVLPGQTEAVTDFDTGPHNVDYNDSGQVMFAADLSGDLARNLAIYVDDTIVAQEGDPSPVAGRNWSSLSSPELSLANTGSYVFSGSLDGDTGSNLLIVRDGAKLVQEGDSIPAIAPFSFTSFGSGPLLIDDSGRVVWYGDWDDPNIDVDSGLFRDQTLLVQEGVTTIDGVVVETLRGVQDGYALSDDGKYLLFEAVLADGTEGAFLLTFSDFVLSGPDPGLPGELSRFELTGATPGGDLVLAGGTSAGDLEVPGCSGVSVGIGNPQPLAFGTADANGGATLIVRFPGGIAGKTIYFQAVDRTGCLASNLIIYTFPVAAGSGF